LIGSSQSIGAGARDVDDTFFSRVHQLMSKDLAPIRLESLNASVSGATARTQLKDYRTHFIQFHPDLVAIDLGTNDSAEDFGEGLTGLLEENRRAGIKTVLVEEPNNPESGSTTRLQKNHATMERLAAEYKVPVYDLHNFLGRPDIRDSGFIWWDFTHLASYGQTVVARWLATRLLNAFESPTP
jgi:lysophospholipase L1-like esterase